MLSSARGISPEHPQARFDRPAIATIEINLTAPCTSLLQGATDVVKSMRPAGGRERTETASPWMVSLDQTHASSPSDNGVDLELTGDPLHRRLSDCDPELSTQRNPAKPIA